MMVSAYDSLDLCLYAETSGELIVLVDGGARFQWPLQPSKTSIALPPEPFKKSTETIISLMAKTETQIDELNLHCFTQKLGLYDVDGQPATNLEAYQSLNALFGE